MTERERKILMGESIEPRTADENAYANVSGGSGGGGIFAVTTSYTEIGDEPAFSNANHTASEILSAVENGQLPVLFVLSTDELPNILIYAYESRTMDGDVFTVFRSGGRGLKVADDGTVTVDE